MKIQRFRLGVIRRLLLLRLRGLGDILQTIAMVHQIRKSYPEMKILLAGGADFHEVGPLLPDGCRYLSVPRGGGGIKMLSLIRLIRAFTPDLAVDLFGNPTTAFLTLVSRAPLRAGFGYRFRRAAYNLILPRRHRDTPISTLFRLSLGFVGIPLPRWPMIVPQPPAWGSPPLVKFPPAPRIAINCNGAFPAKKWPIDHFRELARILLNQGQSVVFFNGPGEVEYTLRCFAPLSANPKAYFIRNPSLADTFQIIGNSSLLITNDSAPLHIALLCGTPVFSIFGPTNPRANGPKSSEGRVFRAEWLSCLVCHRESCPHLSCMTQLEPSPIAIAALEFMAGKTK